MKKIYTVALFFLLPCTAIAMQQREKVKTELSIFILRRKDVPPFPLLIETVLIETVNVPGSRKIIEYMLKRLPNGDEVAFESLFLIDTKEETELIMKSPDTNKLLKEIKYLINKSGPLKKCLDVKQLNENKKEKLRNLLNNNEDVHEAIRRAYLQPGKRVIVNKGMAAKTKEAHNLGKNCLENHCYRDMNSPRVKTRGIDKILRCNLLIFYVLSNSFFI